MNLPPPAAERVLPTLNQDGTRRWIEPRVSRGSFFHARRITAWGLIVVFTLLPYLRLNGKPLVLLDIPRREFTILGTTFLPTDSVLLMLLLLSVLLGIFFLTALYGRVWCGWACPQTVYLEFVYRPLERWIEGSPQRRTVRTAQEQAARRVLKWGAFTLVAMFLAHTFLAYFVGLEQLLIWMRRSPFEHPISFLVMAGVTLAMLVDFGLFREQTCLVACPYGRFQAVLLDRQSMVVGYDYRRGDPRGKLTRNAQGQALDTGHCVDCRACVIACPTGIDIRDGLQMECIACAQCIDACDGIAARLGRPKGLISYTSQDTLDGKPSPVFRPRVVVYPLLMLAAVAFLAVALAQRPAADVTILRGIGSPYSFTPAGEVSNQIRLKVRNRTPEARRYTVELRDGVDAKMVMPLNPLPVAAGQSAETAVFVILPQHELPGGKRDIVFHVADDAGYHADLPYRLLAPAAARHHDEEHDRDEHDRHHDGGDHHDGPRDAEHKDHDS